MRNRAEFSCEYCNADIPILEKTLLACPACGNPSWPAEVKAHAGSGDKIRAIKVYRTGTNVGLKEAKDAVEGIALKGCLEIPGYCSVPAAPTGLAPTLSQEDSSHLEQKLSDLIKKNMLIAAIKYYREKSGVGLKEAKETVEALRDGKPVKLQVKWSEIEFPAPRSQSADKNAEAELLHAIKQGHKVLAVKLYREQTGLGLKASLDAVEAIMRGDKKSPLFE